MPIPRLLLVLVFAAATVCLPAAERGAGAEEGASIAGKLLVASPKMLDPRFKGTVILMVEHSDKGALGFVINRVAGRRTIAEVLFALGRNPKGAKGSVAVHWGGPVDPGATVLLHSRDYRLKGTKLAPGGYAMSAVPRVLRDIAAGKGPKKHLLLRGYAGWGPGQLERELKTDSWIVVPADPSLVFAKDPATTWSRAYQRRGIEL